MALSQVDSVMDKEQPDHMDPVTTQGKGELEDMSLATAAEEKALVRRIDRK